MSDHEEEAGEGEVLARRENIIYCGVCSMPPEFCEFNREDLYAECLRWQSEYHPELLPEGAPVEGLLQQLSLKDSKSGGADAAARGGGESEVTDDGDVDGAAGGSGEEEDEGAADAEEEGKKKKTRRGGGPKPIKKKEPGVGGKVLITRTTRGKRKYITVVTGLDTYDVKIKDVAKALGKAFACGSSVSETATGGKEIVIQGDVMDSLAGMLIEDYNVPEEMLSLKTAK